ncbi:MAG TPA: ACT domain-containing protein [Firmicutes bacterium]|nr:ACT domain-containing protein [Bacillota bacterium]
MARQTGAKGRQVKPTELLTGALDEISATPKDPDRRIVVVVMGRDRIGIIATITGVLAKHSVNVLDITQSIFGQLFAMTLVGDLTRADLPFGELKRELVAAGKTLGVQVIAQKETVFHRMHRP